MVSKCLTKYHNNFNVVHLPWTDELGFYVPFNSISVISERWKGDYERLCAIKRRLGSESISNNGLLVRAITDILFYTDLIGTMVEIN